MNRGLLAAAGLIAALGAAHSYLGERYILIRLFRRPDLPSIFGSDLFTRRTLRFAWHLTTIVWWAVAAILVVMAGEPETRLSSQIAGIIAATALISAVVTAAFSRGRHLAWVVFLAVALLVWLHRFSPLA
jgi:hypothetical protein